MKNYFFSLIAYSRSFLPGFLPGSLDKKPKINKETKNVTTV